jgi:hypothetical protein
MLGDVIHAYSNCMATLGYNENREIDQEDYAPAPNAHKSYYVQGTDETGEMYSGNFEQAVLGLTVTVLLHYPRKLSYADSEAANWNLICAVQRGLLALAATRGDSWRTVSIDSERYGDYKRFKINATVEFPRSLAV